MLRRIRRRNRWSGSEMARRMGLRTAYLSNIEYRRSNVSNRQILRFAESLDVPPHDLLAANLEDGCRRLGLQVRARCRAAAP